jgi:ATP:corrinoid adenosyltransferase
MSAEEITLNIAVNLGRLARWVGEGKTTRVQQFLNETNDYVGQLEKADRDERFEKTFESFKKSFSELRQNSDHDDAWAEQALTWSNILAHRAKFA